MALRERLAASVADIRTRGQRLAQLNLELLQAELKEKGKKFGAAIALFAGAGLLALYAIGFALTTIAVALALVLPLWLSLLIVTLVLFLIVAILALVGRDQIRKIGPSAARDGDRRGQDDGRPDEVERAGDGRACARESGAVARQERTGGLPPPVRAADAAGRRPPRRHPPGPDAPASGPSSDTGARES